MWSALVAVVAVLSLMSSSAGAALIVASGGSQQMGVGKLTLKDFALAGGGVFNGTIEERLTEKLDLITVDGVFTGDGQAGPMTIRNMYQFDAADGGLRTTFEGRLVSNDANARTTAAEFFRTQATATTYGGRKPVIADGDPLDDRRIPRTGLIISGDDSSMGAFTAGQGTLTGTINFDLGGESDERTFKVRAHFAAGQGVEDVPEPNTIALFGIGCLVALHRKRRR